MKKRIFQGLTVVLLVGLMTPFAWTHCEIPCGIYDDEMRIKMLEEHITTMEKAMKQIKDLQKKDPINYNQLVRWIVNKENHANEFQEIVTQYFMTQRIKVDAQEYAKKVIVLHKMLVYTMKCKQTTDLSNIQNLRSLLTEFRNLYFSKSH
jgi:nickel superoxide dismutase